MTETALVFVYGTLKAAHGNHRVVAPFVLDVQPAVVRGFTLWHQIASYPYAISSPGDSVHGEVLTLHSPDDALARLDQLEGVPHHYTREEVTAILKYTTERAFMYVFPGKPEVGWCRLGTTWKGAEPHTCRRVASVVRADE